MYRMLIVAVVLALAAGAAFFLMGDQDTPAPAPSVAPGPPARPQASVPQNKAGAPAPSGRVEASPPRPARPAPPARPDPPPAPAESAAESASAGAPSARADEPSATAGLPPDPQLEVDEERFMYPKSEAERQLEESLRDRAKPVPAAYAERLVTRYLAAWPEPEPPSPELRFDELFPESLAQRLGIAEGSRVLLIGGQPPGSRAALTDAFVAGDRTSWTVKLSVQSPDGITGDVQLPLTVEGPPLPPDPPRPPGD